MHATPCRTSITLIALLLSTFTLAQKPDQYQLEKDWLIEPYSFKSKIVEDATAKTVSIENGLIRRTISTSLGATVAFDNLMTNEPFLRAVDPDLYLTIDGEDVIAGGIQGRVNRAFFTPKQLATYTPHPDAMICVGWKELPVTERFAWKRVRHHAPDAKWPPSGKHIAISYIVNPNVRGVDYRPIWEERFTDLNALWKQHASPSNERNSFQNEGKLGEIYALPHAYCYGERPVSPDTAAVNMTVTPGSSIAGAWGPGMALVFDNNQCIKFNIRPGTRDATSELFAYRATGGGSLVGHKAFASANNRFDDSQSYTLEIARTAPQTWVLRATSSKTNKQIKLATMQIPSAWGKPKAIRVGKLDHNGGSQDASGGVGKELERFSITNVTTYAAVEPKVKSASDKLKTPYQLTIHYEIYDGVPILSKWFTLKNVSDKAINLDTFTIEALPVVEYDNPVAIRDDIIDYFTPRSIHAETDMAVGGFHYRNAQRSSVRWTSDPKYTSIVNYSRAQKTVLEIAPLRGPDQTILPGKTFTSYRAYEMLYDSTSRERRSLALRKYYRTLAPWVTENPLMLHCKTTNETAIRQAIDQCAEVGFESVILSFGSGFNIENEDPNYLAHWKKIADYARSKDIDIGTYSLLSSRYINPETNIRSPKGERPTHGNCPALTSKWGQDYFRKLYNFNEKSGFKVFEHDGSYPGDWDETTRLPLQKGLNDSQWVQWDIIADFYKWCRGKGITLNIPDYYYLVGGSKCGMGYREVNWSLPRAQQVIHTRQNIYDGTWTKTPSMGWMFVPLTTYHGGGPAATVEPLHQHLDHYRMMMLSNLANGVQACYRGTRLYDTDTTRDMVKETVAWFKKHRDILESDVIHLRRADGRDWDGMLHANSTLEECGYLALFNPLETAITRSVKIPLYYTGITNKVEITDLAGKKTIQHLPPDQVMTFTFTIPPQGFAGYLLKQAK